jgi:hypothetical protein
VPEFRAKRRKRKVNGRQKRDGNGKTRAHNNHDDPAFSGLLEIAACEPTSPCSTATFPLGKKARFYRVFFENRFKRRNQQQCP